MSRSLRQAAVVSLAVACASPGPEPAAVAPTGVVPALARHIDAVFATGAAAGMSVAIVQGDSIVLLRALGSADLDTRRPVTAETRFLTASTTKALTALTAVVLDERGEVDLDGTLAELLPGAELDSGLSARSITLRDLLAMRSGIGRDGPVVVRTAYSGEFDTPTLLRLLRHHPPSSAGRGFEYGNVGYNVAALALEHATGRPWQELVERSVLRPLGMRETGSHISAVPPDHLAMPHEFAAGGLRRIPLYKSDRTMHAAGGHVTTARDLARLAIAHLNAGRVPGAPGVSAAVIAESQRRHIDQDRSFAFLHRNGWGLGLDIADYRGDTLYQRNGSFTGYYSHFSFMPSRGIGLVVLTNGGGDGGGAAAERVAQGVYDLYRGDDPAAVAMRVDSLAAMVRSRSGGAAPAALPQPPPPLARYTGRYVDDQLGTLVLEQRGDTLIARLGDAWGIASADRGANTLTAVMMGSRRRLEFQFPDDATPASAIVVGGRTFRRVP